MNPNTWYPGKLRAAQSFIRMSVQELNAEFANDTRLGIKEVALPVSGDLTAIKRGRVRW